MLVMMMMMMEEAKKEKGRPESSRDTYTRGQESQS